MSLLTADYTGSTIFIYDLDGNHLADTKITSHDRADKQIQVLAIPDKLKVNEECKLLILTSPAPVEFIGKVKKVGAMYSLAMFQGQMKEDRMATRYKVSTPATIDSYIYDKQHYELFAPVKVRLINISTGGTRFRAPYYSLRDRDIFRISMVVSGADKSLNAQVMNYLDNEQESSDYGCRFI